METPESMKAELAAWRKSPGIELKEWIGAVGNFSLAVGYASIFWPRFVLFDGYLLREGFAESSLRGFERQPGSTRESVEWVMNHLHVSDMQNDDKDMSKDKILLLGRVLKEIYQMKLRSEFPDHPCEVNFYVPEDEEDLVQYQLSFWQIQNC